jgi:hypothetical protein
MVTCAAEKPVPEVASPTPSAPPTNEDGHVLKSRRGLLAAGLAVAVVGALGVASTLTAGAEQIGPGRTPAAADAPPGNAAGTATPPTVLPWGGRPLGVRKGRAGENSRALRVDGLTAAANDTSGSTQPRGRYAPKGRSAKGADLKTELTDIAPPGPPDPSASPSEETTTEPTTEPTATAEPTEATEATGTESPETTATTEAADTTPTADSTTPSAPEPSGAAAAAEKVSYLYNVGSQAAETDGFYTNVYIAKPTLGRADYHTLGELALQSADGKQIVEIGWNVDRVVNGDDDAHLFIFHWVNRTPACYNGCGFVQYSKNIKPGDTLAADTVRKFGIQYFNGAWWVAFDSEWVGYFPEQLWNDEGVKFSRSGLIQVFGEVAASSPTPLCTEMGTGDLATTSASAYMSTVSFLNGPTVALNIRSTTDAYPVAAVSGRTFRYGGPGAKAC